MGRTAAKSVRRPAKSSRGSAKKTSKSSKTGRRASPAAKGARAARSSGKATARKIVGASATAGKLTGNLDAAHTPRIASPTVQPLSAHEMPLKTHKYEVGQTVYYTSPTFGRTSSSGNYTVVKLLPSEGDDYQYRIKSSGEAFERVAKESQLDNV
jgi:hypothetical protein